jgi:hypothetical protein
VHKVERDPGGADSAAIPAGAVAAADLMPEEVEAAEDELSSFEL